MHEDKTGYYWAYRKGSPEPEIVYVYRGSAYTIWLAEAKFPTYIPEPFTDEEPLSEQKWILGEKVTYDS